MVGGCNYEAYPGVELEAHNASVGAAVHVLFGGRLGYLGSRSIAGPLDGITSSLGRGSLLQAAILAGALHDLGKSSPVYPFKGRDDRASYTGHELAGAVVIHRAALELRKRRRVGEALILELAAWAVARHHSAMKGRHPADLWEELKNPWGRARATRLWEGALKALLGLVTRPECLSRGIPRALKGSWVERALLDAAGELGDKLQASRGGGGERLVGGLLVQALEELSTYPEWLKGVIPPGRWAAYVSIASGALIVADILVAGSEGRGTDEGAGPAYAEWWRRELGVEAVRRVEGLAGDPSRAESVLGEALGAMLRL
jgi:hypothetical protein